MTAHNLLQFKYYVFEAGIYQTFFSGGEAEARRKLDEMMASPTFAQDMNELEAYLNNRSQLQEVVDGVGDFSNNFVRTLTGREDTQDLSAEEISRLSPDALQDPVIQERLMDLIDDKLHLDNGGVSGSIALDRLGFNTTYNLASIPVNMAIGVATFREVCGNLDNPAAAIAALGAITMTRQFTAGYIYYRTKQEAINQ